MIVFYFFNTKIIFAQLIIYKIKFCCYILILEEYYFSRISAMTVIEILYLFLTVGKPDVYKNLSKHEQSIADSKI